MVDRGHIQEQLETELAFETLHHGQQILRAQTEHEHAEAVVCVLEQAVQCALEIWIHHGCALAVRL